MTYCMHCDNTGKFKNSKNPEKFDKEFERLDNMGCFDHQYCYDEAMDYSGYELIIPCPHCGKSPEDYSK